MREGHNDNFTHVLYDSHGALLGMVLSLLNFLLAMVVGYMLQLRKTGKDI